MNAYLATYARQIAAGAPIPAEDRFAIDALHQALHARQQARPVALETLQDVLDDFGQTTLVKPVQRLRRFARTD